VSQEDITQIKVDGQAVGIMGLKATMEEMAPKYRDKPDDEAAAELLNRLGKKNYIPIERRKITQRPFCGNSRNLWGSPVRKKP